MAINKVYYGSKKIIDLSDTTLIASEVPVGKYFYDCNGIKQEGKYDGGTINLQSKEVTPTESSQTIMPDVGYDGLSQVLLDPISSTFVGSEIKRNDETDLTSSGASVTVPAGFYAQKAVKSVATTNQATPSISVNSSTGLITASSTQSAGYVDSGTTTKASQLLIQAAKTVTPTKASQTAVSSGVYTTGAVTVGPIPSEYIVPSGTLSITQNGSGIDVSEYAAVNVAVDGSSPISLQAKTATPTESQQTVTPDTGYGGLSSVTVEAIDSEYVGSDVARRTNSNLTASGATVTAPAGYYASSASKSVATATQATPGIEVSSAGLITASATQTAGYVSAGTKSATHQLTTQAAKTITPTKSSQTAVSSGRYTTGAVTVAAIPAEYITTTDATATAAQINSGATAYVNGAKVTGTQVVQTCYTGTSDPASSLGSNGDVYLKVVS